MAAEAAAREWGASPTRLPSFSHFRESAQAAGRFSHPAMLPPLTQVGSDEFIHFSENTRVIKPDGWAISTASSEEEINAALTLFDYFFAFLQRLIQL